MSLDYIIGGFARYQRLQSSNDDDAVDRLNHIYTVTLLVVLSIFVSGKQYVGNAIECFCECGEFAASKRDYVETYCWLKNTYKVNSDLQIPKDREDRKKEEIAYYQWVPIALLVMAAMFKLPNLLWRVFSYNSGMDLNQVASLVINSQVGPTDKAKETMKQVAEYIDRWLEGHRQFNWNAVVRTKKYLSKRCCFFCFWGKRFGTYLTGLYLLAKFLFVLIDIFVFLILQKVLGDWYSLYGFNLLAGVFDTTRDDLWNESPYFPKVTFCDTDIAQQTNKQAFTVQCALPINMFNEKIFAFLWFWMFMVSVVTVINFLYWVYKWVFGGLKYIYNVKKFLKAKGLLVTEYDRLQAGQFGRQYLRRDGAFVLAVILNNSNEVVMGDLVSELWKIYRSKPMSKRDRCQGDVMYI
ncbi:innexin unc-9-like isoform X3 [Physella acuta]|uniref:innexin unc-9-like isoform X3 n=1 Tax=Physella acuta TaxID=109671 RepID=UPI0027DDFF92|nr:innexin unc-9-like isoform X3 [Physella acuta]